MSLGYRRFLILSAPRSGTHMLRTSLNAHPGIVSLAEMLNPDLIGEEPYDLETPVEEILKHHIYCERPPEITAVGFALHRNGAPIGPWANAWPMLEQDHELRVVLLHRHDLLRRFLSFCLMRERNRSGRKDYRPKPRSYVPEILQTDFEHQERDLAAFRERFRDHEILQVSYEELCERRRSTLESIQRFLGVSPRDLSPGTSRNQSPPIHWLIENFDELATHFQETRWGWFFRRDEASGDAPIALRARVDFSFPSPGTEEPLYPSS